jgi:hypothetical protein
VIVTGNRADALARLDVFAGEWVLQARCPGGQPTPPSAAGDGPQARSRFEWALDRQFLESRRTSRPWISGSVSPPPSASQDGNTISGAWEKRLNGSGWEHDFALNYRRAG